MMLLGGGFGFSLFLFGRAVRAQPEPLAEVFGALDRPGLSYNEFRAAGGLSAGTIRQRGIDVGLSLMERSTPDFDELQSDLAVAGRSIEQHAITKVTGPIAVLLAVSGLWLLFTSLGTSANPLLVLAMGVGLAGVAFVYPDFQLRAFAKERRLAFSHALSAYLDLVSIILAGGGGLQTALQSAADAGDGWAFRELRVALNSARLSNRSPWDTFAELGTRFSVREMQDLAASANLAGDQGARIQETVGVKADVLRSDLRAQLESDAEARSEKMLVPVAMLLVALFLFVGFAVFAGLGTEFAPAN